MEKDKIVYIIQSPPFWVKTPPLGLAYLKSYFRNTKTDVKVLDLNLALFQLFSFSKTQWLNLNEEFEQNLFFYTEKIFPYLLDNVYKLLTNADIVGFSIFKRNITFSFALAKKIKEKFPEKQIVFGGPQTLYLSKTAELNPDYTWIIGEGEKPLGDLINNRLKHVYFFEEIDYLDNLPFLDFHPLNIKAYSSYLPIFSSRGCPFQCGFCAEKLLYKKFRCHCPQYIIDQIKYLINRYEINNFIFCDSMFNHDNNWLEKFCLLVIQNKLNIKWEAQIRITSRFPADLPALMKKSGCYNLFIGLESGSDKMLELMNKGFNSCTALNFLNGFKSNGLHFEISLILGYPGETEEDFRDTIDFIVQNKGIITKIAQINPFIDYLGNFPDLLFPQRETEQRIKTLVSVLKSEKIKYTRSFINNLVYRNDN